MKFNIYSKFWYNSIFAAFFMLAFLVLFKIIISATFGASFFINELIPLIARLTTFWIIIGSIIYCIQFKLNKPFKEYEANGDLQDWYQQRLSVLGTNWCIPFIDNMLVYLPTLNFSFVSPTANEGIYEKTMFLIFLIPLSMLFLI